MVMQRQEVPRLFFTNEEQEKILDAIAEAEKKTSAEMVVRLERNCPGDPLVHCRDLFQALGFTSTASRSGVIIYLSLEDHKVAVFGDESVHRVIGQERWHSVCAQIVEGFQQGRPAQAV